VERETKQAVDGAFKKEQGRENTKEVTLQRISGRPRGRQRGKKKHEKSPSSRIVTIGRNSAGGGGKKKFIELPSGRNSPGNHVQNSGMGFFGVIKGARVRSHFGRGIKSYCRGQNRE